MKIVRVERAKITRYRDGILKVYREAFSAPPYCEGPEHFERFNTSLASHLERPGFHCYVALEPDGDKVVGFAYGYSGLPGGWWWDTVACALDKESVVRWLEGCFEFVELAVMPAYQRKGIGTLLHNALLDGIPHRKAVLSTLDADTPARRLYERMNWTTLLKDFRFPSGTTPYVIMARDLTARNDG
ncbi:GNAT family N-acetyltransferase [Thermaerobacter subterraneus]|uniref:Acetyltransferase n=1 Tax=Thermaerobacter subterraneus DSM 13965 TaxID=867903 RepID=K6PQL6_9FIRM|nr:GNAT family N-acetyltransferase [Thermaerobacter subterraneus]EKP95237.1 acetyltransferase [Thermaerobacter subterraneus DSM 13965]